MKYKHLFGPVPSRRLGISLGVDLVPHKVCSLNCVYCEVGKTTNLTIERQEYIPLNDILTELKNYLDEKPDLDYITFSGAGEPLLHNGIGKVISFIKDNYPQYKLALLTNSTLLYDKDVRNEILGIDLLLPSLDAVSEKVFKKLNRPNSKLDNNKIIEDLIEFRKSFKGKIWLELFIVPSLNDTQSELELLKKTITDISPDQVQLNTLDRPGTESWIEPITKNRMEEIADFFKPLPVEIIAKFQSRNKIRSYQKDVEQQIIETIKRRPCTDKDLSEMLGIHINEINKYLSELLHEGSVVSQQLERGTFFRAK
ncbi:MAG: radical SAM protein [Candidatus Cloacimonetes bacterium]|jgi:wyosine [tRNA(Phe)-imidazoG37] synthetase (radical SAM superfamily)|nr:radical SAM protein [Candidatus Cloacimonadota bacterium]